MEGTEIMEYIILGNCHNTASTSELVSLVNQYIEKGFVPIGGVAVRVGSASGAYFIQAMVKNVGTG